MDNIRRLHWLRKEKKDLLKKVQDIELKILELNNLSSAPVGDGCKGSGVSNPTEQYVLRLTALKDKRLKRIMEITEIENETEEFIDRVKDSEVRMLMRKYYIDGLSWNDIARLYYKRNCDGSTPRKKVSNYMKGI